MRRTRATFTCCAVIALTVSLAGCAPFGRIDPREVARTDRDAAWVVLVAMSAENGLGGSAVVDLNEMERAGVGQGPVVVLALVDRAVGEPASGVSDGAVMLEIGDDPNDDDVIRSRELVVPGLGLDPATGPASLNMGDPHVLASAIEFARTAYAPDRLAVVVWGPGSGYRSIGGSAPLSRATSYDEGSGGDALLTAELTTALEGDPVDVVGFDTSFAASIEVAWQIRSNARLMVASQGAADADGWPYQAILEEFAASDLSSEAFVRSVVTRLADRPGARSYDTVSAIDLSRVDELTAALDDFSGTLHAAIAGAALRDSVRATLFYEVEGFYSTPGDLAIDLGHMAEVIHREYDLADTAALALGAAVESAVALNHTGADHASATGLSVHLIPLDDEGRARATHDPAYQRGGGAADQPGFVTASAWSPQIPDGPGLLYRLFYELM